MGALSGTRVLELGEGKGLAYAGKLLRDLGAEVIKLEPPGGDAVRAYGPFPGGDTSATAGLHAYFNGGKRLVEADRFSAEGQKLALSLAETADVLLHSLRPADAERAGLTPDSLLARSPQLVVTALTPFGFSGPYSDWKGYALQSYAGSGVPYRTGDPAREPLTSPLDQAEIQHGAVQAAAATALALVHRTRTGKGQFVDISVMDAVTSSVSGNGFANVLYHGTPPGTRTGRSFGPSPWGIYETADGFFDVITLLDRQWHDFVKIMGEPEWALREPFATAQGLLMRRDLTPELIEEWRQHLAAWFRQFGSADIWKKTRASRVSFQPLHTVQEVLESDHVIQRQVMVDQPGVSPALRVPGSPFSRMSKTPASRAAPPAEVEQGPVSWADRQSASDTPAPRHAAPATSSRPLEGLRVIDLTQVWAGPLMVRFFADYGADVIMVETAKRPRTFPLVEEGDESPLHWESLYRNRRSVQLDLANPDAVQLFKRLLASADVLVDNFTPRVMPNFGMPYEELAAEFPHLIIAALSATGRDGPWSDLLTYGPSLTALYGAKRLTGYQPNDVMEDVADLDPVSAGYGALGVLAALNHRDRTGQGQFIEIAQGELAISGFAEAAIDWMWNQQDYGPQGNGHRVLAPHGIYPCTGDDRWIAIACGSDEEWSALAGCMDGASLASSLEFTSAEGRRKHAESLDAAIGEWTAGQEAMALATRLQEKGVAAFPVMDVMDLIGDEHHQHRRSHFDLGTSFAGERLYDANAWRMSLATPSLRHRVPRPGEHNQEVFTELGLTQEEISAYERDGVIS